MGRFSEDGNKPVTNQQTMGNMTLKSMINNETTKKKFRDLLGNKAQGFLVSILNTTNGNDQLQKADPNSILKAGIVAATLDLPVDPNLGFAYIVPYGREAQFQLGYKGYIQLAIRTGQYSRINVTELYEGQFISYDPITDILEYDLNNKLSDEVTHYVAYFKTINGFEKYFVMGKEEVTNHAKTYSKAYTSKHSPWQKDFNGMARKTVLKLLLSKFGILSIDMQTAQKVDQAIIKSVEKDNIDVEYTDNNNENAENNDITDITVDSNGEDTDITADDLNFNSADKFKK